MLPYPHGWDSIIALTMSCRKFVASIKISLRWVLDMDFFECEARTLLNQSLSDSGAIQECSKSHPNNHNPAFCAAFRDVWQNELSRIHYHLKNATDIDADTADEIERSLMLNRYESKIDEELVCTFW